ncbi:hypothetical protein T492DRAFT_842611 [Pavlovales sp. CCMP2436]|nr:hypothetical protein T492DRAFT_842611 [Pavlovales sp. CCMP2436]
MANKENGWEAPLHDKEWRRWLGASDGVYNAVAKLLTDLRTAVDGIWEKHLMAPEDFGAVGKILRRDLPAFLRASYAPLYAAGVEIGKLGYSMDLKLSTNEAKVFFSAATGAVVCFRGSNLQLGVGIFGPRHQRSKALMEKVQAKYGPAHAIGHSLGGHLAEHSGARGLILTVDKAVGVRDLGAQTNPNELDIRARGDAVSALSHGGLREEVTPTGKPAAAPHLLPGSIRAPLGMIIRGLYAHDYRHI